MKKRYLLIFDIWKMGAARSWLKRPRSNGCLSPHASEKLLAASAGCQPKTKAALTALLEA